jgi:hypothetical protein
MYPQIEYEYNQRQHMRFQSDFEHFLGSELVCLLLALSQRQFPFQRINDANHFNGGLFFFFFFTLEPIPDSFGLAVKSVRKERSNNYRESFNCGGKSPLC